jgi:hydroxyethylthiazole kinase
MRHSTAAFEQMARTAGSVLARLRTRQPRVHCITNNVAQNFTANALLAAGCVPSMTLSPEEVGDFVASAQGLLVNLGTFDGERREAVAIALKAAAAHGVPWVLDPVFVDRSAPRADHARGLIASNPRAVRLNAAEFGALAGHANSPDALARFAREKKLVVALSGETDWIADGARLARVGNGHPLMARVTAMGCAASALLAACLAVEADAFQAAVAALVVIGVAGEIAAEDAQGPGSFAVAVIDALYRLDETALVRRAEVSS